MARQFAAARAFFELPVERKMEIMVDKYHRCGVVLLPTVADATTPHFVRGVCAPVSAVTLSLIAAARQLHPRQPRGHARLQGPALFSL